MPLMSFGHHGQQRGVRMPERLSWSLRGSSTRLQCLSWAHHLTQYSNFPALVTESVKKRRFPLISLHHVTYTLSSPKRANLCLAPPKEQTLHPLSVYSLESRQERTTPVAHPPPPPFKTFQVLPKTMPNERLARQQCSMLGTPGPWPEKHSRSRQAARPF